MTWMKSTTTVTVTSRAGFGGDAVDLVVVAVDHCDPVAAVLGVAALRLVKQPADDARGVLHDARGQPLVLGGRSVRRGGALRVVGGQDVGRCAQYGRDVVDGANLGHPLAVALLALAQPRS